MKQMSEKTANPAPLGLLGFGVTTILLNFVHNARLYSIDGTILAMGIFYGGLAQVIAGMLEYKKGNTFGTVAFTSYGFFWLSFVALNWLGGKIGAYNVGDFQVWPFGVYGTPWIVSNESFMAYFLLWGIFTFAMFFGTLKINRALQVVFMSLAILFFLLTIRAAIQAYVPTISGSTLDLFTQIIGAEGIICGASAVYLAIAEILNEIHGKTVLPIGPVS
jgi:succinate-acetate transporter protein